MTSSAGQNELLALQGRNAELEGKLQEEEQQMALLRQQLADEQRKEQQQTPRWMAKLPAPLAAALPAIASAISLLSLLLAAGVVWAAARQRQELTSLLKEARPRVKKIKTELELWRATASAVPAVATVPASSKPERRREESAKEAVASPPRRQTPRAEAPKPAVAAESAVPELSEPAAPEAVQQPAEPVPAPQGMTGDPVADDAVARAEPERAAERLREQYGSLFGLSCTNLEQGRRADAVALRFAESPRPTFLAFASRGETVVLPAPDRDLLAMRQSLEGVFVYPAEPGSPLRLVRPAVVRQAGTEWVLESPGELALG